jgi:hypothetical protein
MYAGSHWTRLEDDTASEIIAQSLARLANRQKLTKQQFIQGCIVQQIRLQMYTEITATRAQVELQFAQVPGEVFDGLPHYIVLGLTLLVKMDRADTMLAQLRSEVDAGSFDSASADRSVLPDSFVARINAVLRQQSVVRPSFYDTTNAFAVFDNRKRPTDERGRRGSNGSGCSCTARSQHCRRPAGSRSYHPCG